MADLPDWTRSVAVEVNAEAPTEYWLAKNGTRIGINKSAYNQTRTLYTVPTGKTLYVLQGGLQAKATSTTCEAKLYEANAAGRVLFWMFADVSGTFISQVSKLFYRAVAGEDILLFSYNMQAKGWFVGYEIEE